MIDFITILIGSIGLSIFLSMFMPLYIAFILSATFMTIGVNSKY